MDLLEAKDLIYEEKVEVEGEVLEEKGIRLVAIKP